MARPFSDGRSIGAESGRSATLLPGRFVARSYPPRLPRPAVRRGKNGVLIVVVGDQVDRGEIALAAEIPFHASAELEAAGERRIPGITNRAGDAVGEALGRVNVGGNGGKPPIENAAAIPSTNDTGIARRRPPRRFKSRVPVS